MRNQAQNSFYVQGYATFIIETKIPEEKDIKYGRHLTGILSG